MKRCPVCYEGYGEGEKFCELDGQRLLSDPAISPNNEERATINPSRGQAAQQPWFTGFVGVTVGILLCGAFYAAHTLWSSEADAEDQQVTAYSPRATDPVQHMRPAPARSPESTSDSLEEGEPTDSEAEASPELSPEQSPVPEPQTVVARLNQGPVSTGPKVKDTENRSKAQTIIVMTDGTTVEVDAAWEDKQGIWYRRGGLVSFVDSQLVKAITARAEPKSSPPDDSAP